MKSAAALGEPSLFREEVNDAMHAMLFFAGQALGLRFSARKVSLAVQVPPARVRLVLEKLTAAGLLSFSKDEHRGYMLARLPDDVNLLQVAEAVQGPVALRPCQGEAESCERAPSCAFRPLWRAAQRDIIERLSSENLGALARKSFLGKKPL